MILGVIPARRGSKNIPHKNLALVCGKPLIQYTIEQALLSKLDDVVVSTEDEEIATFATRLNCKVLMRPEELAQDDTPMLPVIQHAVEVCEMMPHVHIDAVVTLQPTSPLRTAADIKAALRMFKEEDRASLVSVCEGIHPVKCYSPDGKPLWGGGVYDKGKHRCLVRNGAIFISRRDLLDSGRLWDTEPLLYCMPKWRSVDIDGYDDLLIAEALLRFGGLETWT